jgi:putative protease
MVLDKEVRSKLNKKNFELLMPAGDIEKAKFAIAYGADAIYCGIPMFTLRGKSNMSLEDLKYIIPYARERNVRVYLAVNIFPHSFKYEQFLKDMRVMVQELKPDAFIMADPGLIDTTMENFPQAEIHLSVQQNNVNWMSTRFWYKIGIKRIVLARELSLKEVELIHEKVKDMEIEFFIHGSNCMAYSGRCLLSNYMNYRDSNQGVCNNACRYKYKVYKAKDPNFIETLQDRSNYKSLSKGKYFVEEQLRKGELYEVDEDENGTYIFNSKDNCMAEHIEKLVKAGVSSFKVEGRTKSLYYTAIVARTYRKIFDDIKKGKEVDIDEALKELNTTSNRGFIPGFLEGNPKDNAIDYEKKTSHQTHLFVGYIKHIENKKNNSIVEVVSRGQFKIGDELEFVMPHPIPIKTWKVNKILKKVESGDHKELESVAGGLDFRILLELPFEIESQYCIIRRKLNLLEIKKLEN